MRCIAIVTVDLERSPLGTRSRLSDDLAGTPVLRRTVERVLACKRLTGTHLLCSKDHAARVKEIVQGLQVKIETHDGGLPPYAMVVRVARWWGLDSWRGGVGGLSVFDEDFQVEASKALAAREDAAAVTTIPAAAAVIDSEFLDAILRHHEENAGAARMTFVQAPPGLAAMVLSRNLLEELSPTGQPPGVLMTYHPDRAMADLTGKEACYRPVAEVIEASGRLLADTKRGVDRLNQLFEAGGENWDAARIARWLLQRRESYTEPIPSEIEIELTTDDALANSLLRPRGSVVGIRGPIRQNTIQSVLDGISEYDDVKIVLGGFGEPCLHPALPEICNTLRQCAAVASIAVRTSALFSPDQQRISETAEHALFETPLDVIEVMIDAASCDTYLRVHGIDGYEQVLARMERWIARREQRQQVRPLIVPSFVKSVENLDDMEAFFDTWQRRLGMSLITGYSHCASQRPSLAVTSVAPPARSICKRTLSRMIVLADGRVTTCDQDFAGRQSVGVIGRQSLHELWNAPLLKQIRCGDTSDAALCSKCDEWHRP